MSEVIMNAPAPSGPTPSPRQISWQGMEFYGFVHFTVNTFTGKEWGYGDESPSIFNPAELDCRQWAAVARDAGMTGLILTAKHHDGFCLWPSKYTDHSVKNSPWKNGKGDVVREFADACREFGLRMGIYLSPWDRNHAGYGGPSYIEYYRQQLEELLTGYGELFEVWFDGANGGDGYYGGACEKRNIDSKTYYELPSLHQMIRTLQPDAVIHSGAGPDTRWVGNETGFASNTCWAKVKPEGFFLGEADGIDRLGWGEADGTVWRPAEADVSIRPGWFYHEDEHPKSLDELLAIYYASVGRGCSLNLNLPPDGRGLIMEVDAARMREFGQALSATFANDAAMGKPAHASNTRGGTPDFDAAHVTDGNGETYWAADDNIREASITVDLGDPVRVGYVRLEEYTPLGQRIAGYGLDYWVEDQWLEIAVGTTIGPRRILPFSPVKTGKMRLRITGSQACPTLKRFSIYTV